MSNSNFLGVAVVSTDLVRNTLRSPDFIVSVVETHGASIQILNVGGGIEGSMIISESWEDSGFKAQLKVNRGTSLTTFGIGAKEGSTCMTRGPKDDSVFDIDIETQVGIGPMAMAHAEKSREVSICALHGASVGVTDSLVLSVKLVPRTLTKALQDLQEWGLNSYNESLRAIGYPGQASAPSRGSLEAPGPDKKPGDGGGKGGGERAEEERAEEEREATCNRGRKLPLADSRSVPCSWFGKMSEVASGLRSRTISETMWTKGRPKPSPI